jgi:hypothetical protein
MLLFQSGVCCHLLRHEMSLVLHTASAWAAIAGLIVVVVALDESDEGPAPAQAVDLVIDLPDASDQAVQAAALCAYLARTLGVGYWVTVDDGGIHVQYAPPV